MNRQTTIKRSFLCVLAAALLFGGCDLVSNENPNAPNQAAPSQLIANAMLYLPGLSSSPQGEYHAQYLSKVIYVSGTLYEEGGTSFYSWYEEPLLNLQAAQDNATTANQAAVARILKAYIYWNLTDRWGDIPYAEALQGIDDFTPAYDPQAAIYDSLFAELKAAGAQIDPSGTLADDVMYGGDMEKWRTFSNTVRLLMALRLSEVEPERAAREFNAALEDGVMTSNDDSFVFEHLATANNENYWYNQVVRTNREWWVLSEGLVGMMNPVGDPRLPVYGDATLAGEASGASEYAGLPFGTTDEALLNTEDYSLLGAAIHEQDAPVYLVTYAEALFAKAEAAARGWTAEDAEANYEAGVEQSILQWTGGTAGADEFLSQPEVAYDADEAIARIANQRYVHLFMHGYQAWAEYRRTGYPEGMVEPQGRAVPLRLSYTSDESFNNTENYEAAVDRQFGGENTLYGRLWWDVD